MPKPNTFVAEVASSSPALDRAVTELARSVPISVQFAGDQVVNLDPANSRSAPYAGILDQLHNMRRPAYIEFDAATRRITLLLIPLVSRVLNIAAAAEDVTVELELSHARHLLRRANPYFGEFLAVLRDAQANQTWVAVTDDKQEIIDARPFAAPASKLPPQPLEPKSTGFDALIDWLRRLFWCLRCVSAKRAQEMFDLVAAQSCDPKTVPAPCIPFLYPDNGCWARAHEMCRLMIAAGVQPKKVWSSGLLHAKTRNNPKCFVDWAWHVAPTLCVRTSLYFIVEDRVIDPSLFTAPVSKQTWKDVQSKTAQLMDSDWTLYLRPAETDPGFFKTQSDLYYYRAQLKLRSINDGAPPYANC
jgi:hypothetical protein